MSRPLFRGGEGVKAWLSSLLCVFRALEENAIGQLRKFDALTTA